MVAAEEGKIDLPQEDKKHKAMTLWLILILVPMLIGLWAQMKVSGAVNKWSQYRASSGVTGAQAAREILDAANIRDVEIVQTQGFLGDHYDPTNKRLCLSPAVYGTPSVAALGIAAHEAGHAIQHAAKYGMLHMRMALVPMTMFASQLLPFVIMGGFFFRLTGLMMLGVFCYLVLTVFQLITLPVEFDASRRAKVVLSHMGLVQPGEEAHGVNDTLDSAAWTYVAAFVASLGNLIYLLMHVVGMRTSEE